MPKGRSTQNGERHGPERWIPALQGSRWGEALQGAITESSYEDVARAWTSFESATGDPGIALYFGEQFGHHSCAVNCLAALCRNSRRALELIAGSWQHMSHATDCRLERHQGRLILRYRFLGGLRTLERDVEYRFAGWLTLVRMIQGEHVKPVLVRFEFPAPPHAADYERVFRAPIEWGQAVNELQFDAKGLDLETSPSARKARQFAYGRTLATNLGPRRAILAHRALVMQLTAYLRESNQLADISLKTVAPRLGVSIRTLQRALDQHGLTFREVLDSTRMAKAEALVQRKGVSIMQIAKSLGYSNQQNFTRAFHRWFGRPPTSSRSD